MATKKNNTKFVILLSISFVYLEIWCSKTVIEAEFKTADIFSYRRATVWITMNNGSNNMQSEILFSFCFS